MEICGRMESLVSEIARSPRHGMLLEAVVTALVVR